MKILFLTSAPRVSASSRYRIYNYIERFSKDGHKCHVSSGSWDGLFKKHFFNDNFVISLIYYIIQFTARLFILFRARFYDVVVIQRELFFYFPPIFEKMIKWINPKLVFDIDDAMFYADQVSYGRFYRYLDLSKAFKIARLSRQVVVGNSYLKEKFSPFNSNISIIPTPVDTDRLVPLTKTLCRKPSVVVGWIGNWGNLRNVRMIGDILKELAQKTDFILSVVCSEKLHIDGVPVENIEWTLDTELQSLQHFDIGIMPLEDNEYNRGKCGFKALQYMAVGIPVVCSPVGVNKDIVKEGVNGFFAATPDEWMKKLNELINNPFLREKMGEHGRKLVEANYSYDATYPRFKEIIMNAAK